jgi:predicted DCC family thiol-disulfide oxidoreductase YuxK
MLFSYILYDGNFGFCNRAIMLIAKNDKNNNFKFVSSLSDFGIKLLSKHQIRGLEK